MSSRRLGWIRKFAVAFRGIGLAISTERSFYVHLPMAVLMLVLSRWLRLPLDQLAWMIAAIGAVIAAELFNTAIERLARRISKSDDPQLAAACDIASGAVLVASITAAIVGLLVIGPRLILALHRILFAA